MLDSFAYSIWLVPSAEPRTELERLTCELAERFGMPSFTPHVTLCSGMWSGSELQLVNAVECLAAQAKRIEMAIDGMDWTDCWSTFFFLRLRDAEALFELAARCIEGSHLPTVGPHMSLLYGFELTDIHRDVLQRELAGRLPLSICFDSLALVLPEAGRWENVRGWKTVHTTCFV